MASAMRSVLPRRALSAFDFRPDTSRAALAAAFLPPSNRPARGVLEVLEGALHAQLGQDAENGDDEDEGGNEADEGFDDLAVHGISSGWVTLREGAAGGTLMLGIRGSNAAIRRRPASMVTRRIRLHKSTTGRP